MVVERHERAEITRHGVVGEVAGDDLPKPSTLLRNGEVHLSSQRVFDFSQLCLRAITTGFPLDEEFSLPCLAADESETQKIKGLRLAKTRSGALIRCEAAKRDQSSLSRMQRQRELFQPRLHSSQEAPRFGFVFNTQNNIIGISHDDHVALCLSTAPLLGPEIEDVVKIDIGQQR